MTGDDFEEIALPEPPAADVGGEVTFDQAGIDALFGDANEPLPEKSGLRAVIESRVVSHERLPMLEVVCERMVRSFATSMRNLTSDAIEVSLDEIVPVRFGDFMSRVSLPAMIAVFKVPTWQDYGLVTVESNLIYAVVDALLGGKRGSAPQKIEGRAFTTIETSLVSRMIELALREFSAAFEPIAPVTMELERIETSPRFAAIAGPTNIASAATFAVDMDGRGGRFTILLPSATLEPVRGKLTQRFMGEKLGGDTTWKDHMEAEIRQTEIEISTLLGERELRLADVRALEVGQTLAFDVAPDNPVEVQCGGVPLARAQIGRRRNHIAISMVTEIGQEQAR
ncbi:flagellar motor switch protein FliM [Stakelama marina]|uniref:Flagellar motor switch protein FliM n=1 Tax=Stakelama marina TaxID=2826939 RepID=A0A8T4I9B3_9SPHN|nr:flagellar motor switch protein FliM [Stakelama marina]MBR0550923.1 flagellar motor switch protein FliM [Stakelama marina]